jgi:NAD(P)-dependent dehydrogenase (short-subunit alcohol dehydrogenase family)
VDFGLEGRVAAVVGATGGLGAGIACALAASGADIVLVGRARERLEDVRREVARLGRRTWSATADVARGDEVAAALALPPRLDAVVNAAGTNLPERLLDVSEEHFDELVRANAKGAFVVVQAAARRLVAQGEGGAIVTVSSQMGHVGAVRRSVYCMTKHAVEGLTKAAALELAPDRIRVNALAPTFVETDMTRPFLADRAFRDEVLARIPLGRLGRVADVAAAAVFLASPAAALITGTSLLVDGGWTAQ